MKVKKNPEEEIGKIYGKLTVLKVLDKNKFGCYKYEVQCLCGTKLIKTKSQLNEPKNPKCKPCHLKYFLRNNFKHGKNGTSVYQAWESMIKRCTNKNSQYWHCYGGRGIKVCEEWKNFENFYKDMGEKPKGLQLDRIDNDGDYKTDNCRWVTPKENTNNRRCSKKNKLDQLAIIGNM